MCRNLMVQTEATIQKRGICIIIHVPVDGNTGLQQVRGAAIEEKWLIIRMCCIMHAEMLCGWLENSHSSKTNMITC